MVKADPPYIELNSRTMPFTVDESAKMKFPELGKDVELKMPPAAAGAKVDFTLKLQKEGGYCLTAKSGDKSWMLKKGTFSDSWEEIKK